MRSLHLTVLALFLSAVLLALATEAHAAGFPPRPHGAMNGSQFIAHTRSMNEAKREAAILAEVTRGNVPSFLRQTKPVRWKGRGGDGRWHDITLNVLPDYLAIGDDADFVRIPMNPLTAQRLADKLGFALPTTKVVDVVYRNATVKLAPRPLAPGRAMVTSEYYLRHQRMIETQRGKRAKTALIAGHKKDVVVTNRLRRTPGRVAIYGWHRPNGRAIQPLSLVHENTYADYSHGIRFVSPSVTVDGHQKRLEEVMRDRKLSMLVSNEGPMFQTRVPMTPGAPGLRAPAKWKKAPQIAKGKAKRNPAHWVGPQPQKRQSWTKPAGSSKLQKGKKAPAAIRKVTAKPSPKAKTLAKTNVKTKAKAKPRGR